MAHTKVTLTRKWYGKIPMDKHGNAIPKNLWPKRRKHSWEVRWYDSTGKRLSKSFKSRKEADQHARQLQDKVDNGKADKPKQITLGKFIKEHKQLMKGQVAYATLEDQMRALRYFSEHIGSNIQLINITPRHAESFIAKRLGSGLAVSTVNKDINALKAIFNLAIEPRGYLTQECNPFAKIKKRKVSTIEVNYVPPENFNNVLLVAPDLWWKTFLTLAYTSSGRRNELLNLTWANVDFENQAVKFSPKKHSEYVLEWEPKDHEVRVIPIPEKTLQLLADLQAEADEKSPYVFIKSTRLHHILALRSQGRWNPRKELVNNLLTHLKSLTKRAKVDTFTLHDLRRSCITNWARELPIQVVQHLAGHSSMETTRKYYLSIQEDDMDRARGVQDSLMTKLTNY